MLFSDIEGSTRLLSRLGERWAEALSVQRSIMRAEIARWGGREMGTEGDSFFVVFASATDAVRAALAMQHGLQAYAWPLDEPVRVRMGLHSGEPNRHDDGYVGIDVHRAARIAAAAHGGQIAMSATTAQLGAAGIVEARLSDLGWHRLKDIPAPEHIFQVTGEGLLSEFPPLRSLGTQSNLPPTTTAIVGRDGEQAELAALFARPDVRLVTLTGPGGSGKTRLAIAVAGDQEDERADGVYFVPLSSVTSAGVMWSTIGEVLDIPGEGRAPPTLFEYLSHRDAFVVLDNLEQVGGASTVVSELLSHAPGIKVLATSRRPLHVAGEFEHPVPPLEFPDAATPDASVARSCGAVALFVERARMVRPNFSLDDSNLHDVVSICARLDGMPLAIELAAARSKLLSPKAILARLDDSLGLRGTELERPERQRTLRDTIAWSYDLLSSEQQAFFRQLGVFAGGCDLDAVAAVARGAADPLDELAELADASLVTFREGRDGEPRAGLLQTVRAFAREQLVAAGEWEATARRHAEHYLAMADEVTPRLRSPQYLEARDRIELELDNLRAALEWALGPGQAAEAGTGSRVNLGLELCRSLAWFWYGCGYPGEGRRWLERAVQRSAGQDTPEVIAVLHGLGVLLLQQGDDEQAKIVLSRCLAFWRERGDASGMALELNSLSVAHRNLGDIDTARDLLTEGVELARKSGDCRKLASLLSTSSVLEIDTGAPRRAIELLSEALEVDSGLEDAWGVAVDRVNLSVAHLAAGQPAEATECLRAVAADAFALNDVDLTISMIEMLAAVASQSGEAATAARLLGTSETMRAQAALPRPEPDTEVLERFLANARSALDEPSWQRHVAAGGRLSAEEAVAEGLPAAS